MKKRITTALSIIGLGLILVVIGCALGGNLHDSEPALENAASGTLGDGAAVRKLLIDTSLVSLKVKPHDKAVFEYTISGEPEIIASVGIVDRDVLKITSRKKSAFLGAVLLQRETDYRVYTAQCRIRSGIAFYRRGGGAFGRHYRAKRPEA